VPLLRRASNSSSANIHIPPLQAITAFVKQIVIVSSTAEELSAEKCDGISTTCACAVQAYQVLSNPDVRKRYDAKLDVSADTDLMASGEFFAMLFGSMRFEEFVGELMISTLARYGGEVTREQVPSLVCDIVMILNYSCLVKLVSCIRAVCRNRLCHTGRESARVENRNSEEQPAGVY
jgi:hypothetical protein